jgi:hypothetical protein
MRGWAECDVSPKIANGPDHLLFEGGWEEFRRRRQPTSLMRWTRLRRRSHGAGVWLLWATAAGRILKVGTAPVRQMLWTMRRARPFQGMLLLVIELTRAEIHGHVVRWPRARKP